LDIEVQLINVDGGSQVVEDAFDIFHRFFNANDVQIRVEQLAVAGREFGASLCRRNIAAS